MAIKRYVATTDTTISNAYKTNLSASATGSNMGASDVLEVFSIYAQANTSSVEKSRALLKFPISTVLTDRNAGTIPQSGSVKFYLRLFNTPHGQTLPRDYKLQVLPLSRSFTEGTGLDMEQYSDDGIANWDIANTTKQKQVTDVKFLTAVSGNYQNKYFSIHNQAGTKYNFWFQTIASDGGPNAEGTEVMVHLTASGVDSAKEFAQELVRAVNTGSQAGTEVTGLSASYTAGITGDSSQATARITVTTEGGTSGSYQGTVSTSHLSIETVQTGGMTVWTNTGGDFHEVGYTAGRNLPHYAQTFTRGPENLEVNITALVEEWIKAESVTDTDRENYGVMVRLSGSSASESSYEDGTRGRSYYTKKFFSRTSEFFYKRPIIEARYDDSKRDDRGSFYLSSSLASGDDNLNTLYLYNYVRGRLKNIPVLGGASGSNDAHTSIHMQIFPSGNVKGSVIKAKTLPIGGGVTVNGATVISGGWVSTGIYSASFAFTGSEKQIFDIWSKPTKVLQGIQLVTGSTFAVKKFDSLQYNPGNRYVTKIINLKDSYSQSDSPRFRVHIRQKGWQPNIYNVAKNTAEAENIENAYYRIYRVIDEFDVISFGTGSGQQGKYTRMSYDEKGNYFDLNMSLFESDYSYAIQLAYDHGGQNIVQEQVFKFRVEK